MSENSDGLIGLFCAIGLACIATFSLSQYWNISRELEQTKLEYRGYQNGVKDSQ